MNQVIETILQRTTVREYSAEPLFESQIESLVEVARHAPCVTPPLHVAVVETTAALDAIVDAVAGVYDENPSSSPWEYAIPETTCLFVLSAPDASAYGRDDCVAAATAMSIAAASMGLGACQLDVVAPAFHGESAEGLRALLGIPSGFVVRCGLSVGTASGPVEKSVRPAYPVTWLR